MRMYLAVARMGLLFVGLEAPRAGAQAPSRGRTVWVASGAVLATALAVDARMRSIARAHQSRSLDRVASGADLLGTAGHLVPALAATYIVQRLTRHRDASRATLRVALSYAAADALESALKPVLGRGRPGAVHDPLTFRPFTLNGDFHSFPSAHVVHVAAVSTAVAIEADRRWVTALAATATTYVAAQRVYRGQHWSSDVVASAVLGVVVARRTVRWLRARDAS